MAKRSVLSGLHLLRYRAEAAQQSVPPFMYLLRRRAQIKDSGGNHMARADIGKRGCLGCVAVVATALTVGVAAPQPGRSLVPVESHPVLLEAAVVSAVANSSAASAVTSASGSPAAATVAAATDDPAAIPRTIAQIVFTAAGIALSPLWYLAFPITLPLTASLLTNSLSNLGAAGWGAIAGLALTPIAWLSLPFVVGGPLAQALFPVPTATVTPAAATARSAVRLARQTSPHPAAARSERPIAHAAASRSSAKSKAATAAPARSSVGKPDRMRKSE